MKPFDALPFLACLALAACSSNENVADTTAPAAPDSAYTGVAPTYPRAKPANLAPPAKPAPPPPAPIAFATTSPAPQPPPAEATSLPAPAPDNSAIVTTTLPAPAPQAPLETTPDSPSVTTAPPRPMSESEAKSEVVVLETSLGNIVIKLNDVAAPRTCGNFRKLVSSGFYNHTLFHRVIPNFIIQGGDPGYTLPAEINLKNVAGSVAMARLPDATNPQRASNGSQFFICVADCPSLDDKYTVFGHVIRGMGIVNKIASAPRDKSDDPVDRIELQASIETKQQALGENPN